MLIIVGVLLTALGATLAYLPAQAGSPLMWLAAGGSQVPLALVALRRMRAEGTLREMLQPRWGDITLGVGSTIGLYALTWATRALLVPSGTRGEAWLMRIYIQIGDPAAIKRNALMVGATVLVITALEEIAWRGLIFRLLEDRHGTRRAWIYATVLYTLSFSPSVWLLRDVAGPNPLLIGTALAGGMVWTYLTVRTQRLVPSILSHAVYLWFVIAQFRLFAV